MKLKRLKSELIKVSLILGILSLAGCVKELKTNKVDNFCEWALPLDLTEKDFNFLEKQASIKLIDVLDVYNTEFNIQCNEN